MLFAAGRVLFAAGRVLCAVNAAVASPDRRKRFGADSAIIVAADTAAADIAGAGIAAAGT
jgi:hypothetical protein